MNLKQFQTDAIKTEKIVESVNVDLKYLSTIFQILICAGNLLDQIKKNVYYDKEIDSEDRAKHIKGIIEAMDNKALFIEDPTANKEILDTNSRLFHAIIGITTESTELLENLTSGNNDIINMLEEIADCHWYSAIAIDEVNADWEQMLDTVIAKLKKRFPEKFNKENAINRNLVDEREILEKMTHETKNITIKDLS